jgi:hypothetical protein
VNGHRVKNGLPEVGSQSRDPDRRTVRDGPAGPGASRYDEVLLGTSRALASLGDAVGGLTRDHPSWLPDGGPVVRGYFRPSEEQELLSWFARFLTVRDALWEVIAEVSRPVEGRVERVVDTTGWRCFVLGYGAACLVVRLDQHLVEKVATKSPVQRKLNEGSLHHRMPRKQFTQVFDSFTDLRKALAIKQAMQFADRNRDGLETMAADPIVGGVVCSLPIWEEALDPSRLRYGSRLLGYLEHAVRRRGASGRQQALFGVLEAGGRLASEVRDRWSPPALDAALRHAIAAELHPGDVLVTRHDRALTNLFLPGYWPHAALFVGSEGDRDRLGVEIDAERRARWTGDRTVLEALKDGVLFRPIEETLAVDAVAVIRPQLDGDALSRALGRAARHEGKGYNFDFDFFRADRLVCTEVVYRAYDGLGPIDLELHERSGRPTLAAEDLLDCALEERGFVAVAVCGAPGCRARVVRGEEARTLLAASYREPGPRLTP